MVHFRDKVTIEHW